MRKANAYLALEEGGEIQYILTNVAEGGRSPRYVHYTKIENLYDIFVDNNVQKIFFHTSLANPTFFDAPKNTKAKLKQIFNKAQKTLKNKYGN